MTTDIVDNEIIHAAIAKYGAADASVTRQELTARPGQTDSRIDRGVWFVLSVRPIGANDWEVIGRRRSKSELWEMVRPAGYPTSTEGVGAR